MPRVPSRRTASVSVSEAEDLLKEEGFSAKDIETAIDSLIDAGLELDQPDDDSVLSEAEVDVLRDQLKVWAEDSDKEASHRRSSRRNKSSGVAETIKSQIGMNVLMSLGASDFYTLGDEGLRFTARILPFVSRGRGSRPKEMIVEIRLNSMDTYDIWVYYMDRNFNVVDHYRADGVYADQLPNILLALDWDGDEVLNPRLASRSRKATRMPRSTRPMPRSARAKVRASRVKQAADYYRPDGEEVWEWQIEEEFNEMLDDVYGEVQIGPYSYYTARALKEVDPTAWRESFLNYIDDEIREENLLEEPPVEDDDDDDYYASRRASRRPVARQVPPRVAAQRMAAKRVRELQGRRGRQAR